MFRSLSLKALLAAETRLAGHLMVKACSLNFPFLAALLSMLGCIASALEVLVLLDTNVQLHRHAQVITVPRSPSLCDVLCLFCLVNGRVQVWCRPLIGVNQRPFPIFQQQELSYCFCTNAQHWGGS